MNAPSQISVFDRQLLRKRRHRAAASFGQHAVLFDEAGELLRERLKDVTRDFSSILELGAHDGRLFKNSAKQKDAFIVHADLSEKIYPTVVVDEEFLPFGENTFNLVISNLAMHWVNDLPGALAQIKYALKPDGLFLASVFGGNTLHELRSCLLDAELAISGGISPRLSPTLDLLTASGLLQRAGFSLPVADQEVFTLIYPDIFALMKDLRGMGETNAHRGRLKRPTSRRLFEVAGQLYKERFSDGEGQLTATFDVLFLHGWKAAV